MVCPSRRGRTAIHFDHGECFLRVFDRGEQHLPGSLGDARVARGRRFGAGLQVPSVLGRTVRMSWGVGVARMAGSKLKELILGVHPLIPYYAPVSKTQLRESITSEQPLRDFKS